MPYRLTGRFVNTCKIPEKPSVIYYDDQIKGFGLRVTKNNNKSFILNYVISGRERRMTIGEAQDWPMERIREHVRRLKREIDLGNDPLEAKELDRSAPTIATLWKIYEERHLPTLALRAQTDIKAMYRDWISSLKDTKLENLTSLEVDNLHRKISRTRKVSKVKGKRGVALAKKRASELSSAEPQYLTVRANRVLEVLRAMLNKGIRWGYCTKNPADKFIANDEEPKEVFLDAEKLSYVFEKLKIMENKQASDIIRLLILTGARLGEVLRSEWEHFDLVKGTWSKPSSHTKQKKRHIVPISGEVIDILTLKKGDKTKSGLIFCNSDGNALSDIKSPWKWLQREADIKGVRIHDLRHSFASLLISEGETLAVIGKLLGHTQSQTTMRYAHLADTPLRAATSKISKAIHTFS